MTKEEKKKIRERHILTRFISHESISLLPTRIESRETPDFEIDLLDNRKISIEITDLINPTLKKRESFESEVIEMAEKMFLNRYGEKLRVWVTFGNKPMIGGIRKNAEMIFDFVSGTYLKNRQYKFSVEHFEGKPFNEHIENIWVHNDIKSSFWESSGAFLVSYAEPKWIIDRVNKKEARLKKYKSLYSQNWLLLVSNFGSESSGFRFERILESPLQTQFDKVYVFEDFPKKVHVIK